MQLSPSARLEAGLISTNAAYSVFFVLCWLYVLFGKKRDKKALKCVHIVV